MFQTTRIFCTMKNGRRLAIALLALASFGAPALSAQTCCFVPNYRQKYLQQTPGSPSDVSGAPSHGMLFYINGATYLVDDSFFVWARNPYGPLMVVGHIEATADGYIATMYSGRRYRAIPVR